jgi:hypothetical protein
MYINVDVETIAIKRIRDKIAKGERLNSNEKMLYLRSQYPRCIK